MASNRIPAHPDALISLAANALEGALSPWGSAHLAQNTADKINTDLTALIGEPEVILQDPGPKPADPAAKPRVPGAQNIYDAAKTAKVASTAARVKAESQGRAFAASAVGLLKNYLGTQWNSGWQEAGFTAGSLAIPDDPLSLLTEIGACLGSHADWANEKLRITAAAAAEAKASVVDARAAAKRGLKDLGNAKAAADTARRNLSKRLSGLRMELTQLLPADDPQWYEFGFDRPGDGWQPAAVDHLVLTPGTPGSLFADWDDTRRADRYKVTKQIPGGPVETVSTTIHDSECLLTGLVSGTDVTITVTAINDAGESPRPATATATVP